MNVAWRRAGEVGRVEAREEMSPSSARERTHLVREGPVVRKDQL